MHRARLLVLRFLAVLLALRCCTVLAAGPSARLELSRELEKLPHPLAASEFQPVPQLSCLNQGGTLICWSFATCSFLESEMARLNRPQVRLSVMYPAYCQFVEKTKRFVRTKGESRFSPGDLFIGVMETCRLYGALPASAYEGKLEKKLPDHKKLYAELDRFTRDLKQRAAWDEEGALVEVRRILNQHMGEPPTTFAFGGQSYTPKSFAAEVVNLPWKDYIMITSFRYAPFNTQTDLRVPDNWQHQSNFLNLELPVYYQAFKEAVRKGFSVAVSMDITEPSYERTGRYCFVLDGEVARQDLNQDLREAWFTMGSTTDDHAIHVTGYKQVEGEDWFLAKDSWKTAWRDGNKGCLFLHSSYIKGKVLAFIVHRDGVAGILPP